MSRSQTRQLGHACRIYQNADGRIIGVDEISVIANKSQIGQISANKFHVYIDSIKAERMVVHRAIGDSRIVNRIMMIGNYSSIEENNGDYFIAIWKAASPDENDVVVSFEGTVAKIGDII